MHFTQQPRTPWVKMAIKRGSLKSGQTIPSLRVEWSPVTTAQLQEKLSSYKKICGFGDTDVPIGYPMVFAAALQAQLLANKGFPLPVLGLVHVAQRMRWVCDRARRMEIFQPGESKDKQQSSTYQLVVTLNGQRQVKRGVVFTLRTSLCTDSESIWEADTDVLSMAAQGHGNNEKKPSPEPLAVSLSQKWSLAADLGRKYAKIAGDFNPIHLYGWSAKLFGFKKAIIHGMWTLAHALAQYEHSDVVSEETSINGINRVEAHFVRPIFLPSEPTLEISQKNDAESSTQFQVWQQTTNGDRKLAMWAVASR